MIHILGLNGSHELIERTQGSVNTLKVILETKVVVRKQSSQSPFHLAVGLLVSDVARYVFKHPALAAGNVVHVTFIATLDTLMFANTTLLTIRHGETTPTILGQLVGLSSLENGYAATTILLTNETLQS